MSQRRSIFPKRQRVRGLYAGFPPIECPSFSEIEPDMTPVIEDSKILKEICHPSVNTIMKPVAPKRRRRKTIVHTDPAGGETTASIDLPPQIQLMKRRSSRLKDQKRLQCSIMIQKERAKRCSFSKESTSTKAPETTPKKAPKKFCLKRHSTYSLQRRKSVVKVDMCIQCDLGATTVNDEDVAEEFNLDYSTFVEEMRANAVDIKEDLGEDAEEIPESEEAVPHEMPSQMEIVEEIPAQLRRSVRKQPQHGSILIQADMNKTLHKGDKSRREKPQEINSKTAAQEVDSETASPSVPAVGSESSSQNVHQSSSQGEIVPPVESDSGSSLYLLPRPPQQAATSIKDRPVGRRPPESSKPNTPACENIFDYIQRLLKEKRLKKELNWEANAAREAKENAYHHKRFVERIKLIVGDSFIEPKFKKVQPLAQRNGEISTPAERTVETNIVPRRLRSKANNLLVTKRSLRPRVKSQKR